MRPVGKYLSVFLGCACAIGCWPYSYHVTLINRTNKEIKSVSVAIHDLAMEAGPLPADQKAVMTFTDAGEGGYHVIVRFTDGQRLEGEVGYVDGVNATDTIDLYSDKIQIEGLAPIQGKS